MLPRDDRSRRRLGGILVLAILVAGCNQAVTPKVGDDTDQPIVPFPDFSFDVGSDDTGTDDVGTDARSDAADAEEPTGEDPREDEDTTIVDPLPEEPPPLCRDPYEPNETREQAGEYDEDDPCISSIDDVDVFTFEALTYSELWIDTEGIESDMTIHIRLEHADYMLEDESDGSLFVAAWPAGVHYVTITSDDIGPYWLHIGVAPLESEPNDTFEDADLLPHNNGVQGCIDGEGDRDIYYIPELARRRRLSINTPHELLLTLHDDTSDHEVVAGPSCDSLSAVVGAGRYYVSVEAADPSFTRCYDVFLDVDQP